MQSSEILQLRRKSVKFQLILLVVVLISFELIPFNYLPVAIWTLRTIYSTTIDVGLVVILIIVIAKKKGGS